MTTRIVDLGPDDTDLVREFVPDHIFADAQVSRNADGTLCLLVRPRGSSRVLRITATATAAAEL